MKSELSVIDSMYIRPSFAAVFIREEGDEVAIIETGTARSRSLILAALDARGIAREGVRYVIVSHAHLDHAGAAAALMDVLPNAKLVAHPRAARHLIDPTKLEASARQVYGDEAFERLYGRLLPVAAERVIQPEDGSTIPFGAGEFGFLHTRGHAKHHFCILDPAADAIFTGDAFGLAYPELQEPGVFIFPSTSPTDFEGEEALASVDRVATSGAGRAMLTHFGELRRIEEARAQLRWQIEFSMEIAAAARAMPEEARRDYLLDRLHERFREILAKAAFIEKDLGLNADGLAWSIRDKAAGSSTKPGGML